MLPLPATKDTSMQLHPRFVSQSDDGDDGDEGALTLHQIRADREAADVEASAVQRSPREAAVSTVDDTLAGVPVRWYLPMDLDSAADVRVGTTGVMVYVHGGGWVHGSIETVDLACRRLALRAGLPLVSVAYRLAPDHQWPAQLDDVDAVVARLAAGGAALEGIELDAARLVVAGDSAGGWLAAAAARRARDAGRPLAGQVLVYPVVTRQALEDRRGDDGSATDFAVDDMVWFWDMMLGVGDDAVPSSDADLEIGWPDDLAGLPDTLVVLAEHDILRPEGEALADALQTAGVDVVSLTVNGLHHGYFRHPAVFSASRAAIDLVATWAQSRMDPTMGTT